MFAIIYKSDGFPVCQQVAGVSPDPVVTWNTEAAAKAFISSKGGDADFQAVQLTDETIEQRRPSRLSPMPANWGETIAPDQFRDRYQHLTTDLRGCI